MAKALLRHLTANPFATLVLIPAHRRVQPAKLRQNLQRLAVVVQIHQKAELDIVALLNHLRLPHAARFARILPKRQRLAEPGAGDDIGLPIAVEVRRQVRKIVDVVIRVFDFAKAVLLESRPRVPVFARHNIELAVPIQVRNRGRFIAAQVDRAFLKRQVHRPGGGQSRQGNQKKGFAHCSQIVSQGILKALISLRGAIV